MNHSLAGVALGLMMQPLLALADSPPATHQFTLDNGLKVIVHEDHRAAVVNSQLWYHVGASYEPPGQSGLSHALEHMLFHGSSKLCAGESEQIYRGLGAIDNAATLFDATIFYQTLPPQALGVALEVMADQMNTAHLTDTHWVAEREVIKNERSETVDNTPNQRALEISRRIAFPASASGSSLIGWMHDLERMHVTELQQWYRNWYAPNNATLVVTGAIGVEQVRTLAQRYFGPIARRELPVVKIPLELPTPGERSVTQRINHQIPMLNMAFNVPSLSTQTDPRTAPALKLLSELLGGGNSSVLKSKLVRGDELLIGATTHYDGIKRGDELFIIAGMLNVKKTTSLSQMKDRIVAEIESLKKTPPSIEDLDRARTRIIAQHIFSRDDLETLAFHLGKLDIAGLPLEQDEQWVALLKTITPEDIQHTAQTFLNRDRLTTGYLVAKETRHD